MPDIWTHILFGEEVIEEMDLPAAQLVKEQAQLFRFACQGPDFFFYYRFWPWKKSNSVPSLGSHIHKRAGGRFVHQGIQYVKEKYQGVYPQPVNKSGDNPVEMREYQQLEVYMIGLICHYALDTATHPYIHFKSGIYRQDQPESEQYKGNHKLLEEIIDTILLTEKRSMDSSKEPVYKQIELGSQLPKQVVDFYQQQIESFFDRKVSSQTIQTAYRDMIKAWQIFYDPRGVKEGLIRFIDWLSFGKIRYFHLFYPHSVDKTVDYLNRKGEDWCHPADSKERFSVGFDQLWEKAKDWAKEWIRAMEKYLHDQISYVELTGIIPNLSFSSGKTPGEDSEEEMRFFEPIVFLK